MFFRYIAFTLGHLFLSLLLLAIPHAPDAPATDTTALLPITEALIVFTIGQRAFLVFCNWTVLQCLCVRIGLPPASFIVPVASYCILAAMIEYVHLRVDMQEQATNQIQDLMLPASQQYVAELLLRIVAIASLGWNIGPTSLAGGLGVNAVGSGQGATGRHYGERDGKQRRPRRGKCQYHKCAATCLYSK